MNRRETLLTIGSALAMAPSIGSARPQADSLRAESLRSGPYQAETYRIWPGRAPLATSDRPEETPTLTVFRPRHEWNDGAAVVIAPGGAYMWLSLALEGSEPAEWMAARSLTAFVLQYRVGPAAPLPVPLIDGARAVRFVRAHAAEFGIDPSKIGMMGFSAGGHLAAMTAEEAQLALPGIDDDVERQSSRPDFLILGYPWLEATDIRPDGRSSYCDFVRDSAKEPCDPSQYSRYSPFARITPDIPPTFIYHTTDDDTAPIGGSIRFFAALHERGVPVEFHSFVSGRHGSGLGGSNPALSLWPMLLQEWMRKEGFLPPAGR